MVLCVKYHNHENIEIRLQTDGLIGIEDLNKYDGVYENESVSLQQSKLILLIYNEIILIYLNIIEMIFRIKMEHQIKADFWKK